MSRNSATHSHGIGCLLFVVATLLVIVMEETSETWVHHLLSLCVLALLVACVYVSTSLTKADD